jgi:hypothetical protein
MFWVGLSVGVVLGLLLAIAGLRMLASVDPLPHRKQTPPR